MLFRSVAAHGLSLVAATLCCSVQASLVAEFGL